MSYNRKAAENKIIDACRQLVNKGLIARTWGNVSARISDNTFLITPSGKGYHNMTGGDLVEVSINNLSTVGNGTPSSEKGIHAIAYSLRQDVDFIVHTHQCFASCISILPKSYNNIIPCADYGLNASQTLIDAIGSSLRENVDSNGFLMSNHGAFCLGRTDEEAFLVSMDLEDKSRKLYSLLTGKTPEFHVDEQYITTLEESDGLYLYNSPLAMDISKWNKEVFPFLDDFAQFAGLSMKTYESLQDINLPEMNSNSLPVRECAILSNKGIVCHADSDDINALSIVIEKQCIAACLSNALGDISPILPNNVMTDREHYVLSYSKLK